MTVVDCFGDQVLDPVFSLELEGEVLPQRTRQTAAELTSEAGDALRVGPGGAVVVVGPGQQPASSVGKQAVGGTEGAEDDGRDRPHPRVAIDAERFRVATDRHGQGGDVAVDRVPARKRQDRPHREVDEVAHLLAEALAYMARSQAAVTEILDLEPPRRFAVDDPLADRLAQQCDRQPLLVLEDFPGEVGAAADQQLHFLDPGQVESLE